MEVGASRTRAGAGFSLRTGLPLAIICWGKVQRATKEAARPLMFLRRALGCLGHTARAPRAGCARRELAKGWCPAPPGPPRLCHRWLAWHPDGAVPKRLILCYRHGPQAGMDGRIWGQHKRSLFGEIRDERGPVESSSPGLPQGCSQQHILQPEWSDLKL